MKKLFLFLALGIVLGACSTQRNVLAFDKKIIYGKVHQQKVEKSTSKDIQFGPCKKSGKWRFKKHPL